MPTQRGWAVAGGGAALVVLWVLFGETELGIAAIGLLAAVGGGVLFVAISPPHLRVSRRITPSSVHEGDHATVTVALRNVGPTLRHLTLSEEVQALGTAEFSVADVARQGQMTATYRILCRPRGEYSIGPSRISVSDPMGLAERSVTCGDATTMTVYPAVERLNGFPPVRGRTLVTSTNRPEHNQRGGEDFYTLREYQSGDDLRRVHWPSSAKRDVLMIRQLDTPWQARALVFFDIRATSYSDEASFERAVSGAASVVRHLSSHGHTADLWAGGSLVDATRHEPPMEVLARVRPSSNVDLIRAASRISQADSGGVLVVVGGQADSALVGVRTVLGPTHPTAVFMSVGGRPSESADAISRTGTISIVVDSAQPWAPAWATAMGGTWQPALAE